MSASRGGGPGQLSLRGAPSVRKLLVTLAGEVGARVDAIAAIWMGCVGRPNLGALIDAFADGIGRARHGV
jgi:hypothetical protein